MWFLNLTKIKTLTTIFLKNNLSTYFDSYTAIFNSLKVKNTKTKINRTVWLDESRVFSVEVESHKISLRLELNLKLMRLRKIVDWINLENVPLIKFFVEYLPVPKVFSFNSL